ncbi:hypothetical protein [Xanthomarina gelatinilytica]|uniref:hypothetical protein n=1 Tax=Xanthomarina gelatinilytica TaxID=1137281 RepID=UPI003AA8F1A8
MKKLNYLLTMFFALTLLVGCDTDPDNNAPAKDTAGLIVDVTRSSGSLLGSPAPGVDLEDAEVELNVIGLSFDIRQSLGSQDNISKFEIYKSYTPSAEVGNPNYISNEILVTEMSSLPYELVYDSLDDFTSGFGISSTDLRIGDEFLFRVKVYQNDGDSYFFADNMGSYKVVVNCLSDLAGTYTINYTSGEQPHYVTELGPGLYEINSMMGWPTSGYKVQFTDTCGVLELLNDWQFSNEISGVGYVDADGNLIWTSVTVQDVYSDRSYPMIRQ